MAVVTYEGGVGVVSGPCGVSGRGFRWVGSSVEGVGEGSEAGGVVLGQPCPPLGWNSTSEKWMRVGFACVSSHETRSNSNTARSASL